MHESRQVAYFYHHATVSGFSVNQIQAIVTSPGSSKPSSSRNGLTHSVSANSTSSLPLPSSLGPSRHIITTPPSQPNATLNRPSPARSRYVQINQAPTYSTGSIQQNRITSSQAAPRVAGSSAARNSHNVHGHVMRHQGERPRARPLDRTGKKRDRNRNRPALKKVGGQDQADATAHALDYYRSFLIARDPFGISPTETWGEPAIDLALEECDTDVSLVGDKSLWRLVSRNYL
jgi:hypothetical protein